MNLPSKIGRARHVRECRDGVVVDKQRLDAPRELPRIRRDQDGSAPARRPGTQERKQVLRRQRERDLTCARPRPHDLIERQPLEPPRFPAREIPVLPQRHGGRPRSDLPDRRHQRLFLRVSSFLQLAAFGTILGVYVTEPLLPGARELTVAGGRGLLAFSPTYWFLGLFQQWNGSPALATLAHRAWIGLALAGGGAAVAYALCYFRTLRQIVEEPDIVPGARGGVWLPPFGGALQTALVRFSIRTLLRSRLHRLILTFYLGMAFAFLLFLLRETPDPSAGVPVVGASIVMMAFSAVGTRVIFSIPLDLRANWIFRGRAPRRRMPSYRQALAPASRRRSGVGCLRDPELPFSALARGRGPACAPHAFRLTVPPQLRQDPIHLFLPPGQIAASHRGAGRCYLLWIIRFDAASERQVLEDPARLSAVLLALALVWVCVRWRNASHAHSEEAEVQFEESETRAVQALGLNRDGSWPSDPPVPS